MITQVDFKPGDTIRVHTKIKEIDTAAKGGKEKTRIQIFEGMVLGIKGRGDNKTFIVRKMVDDVAVERIFPVLSPNIAKVEIKKNPRDRIRRAKLFFVRDGKHKVQ